MESALYSNDAEGLERAIRCDEMLHAWMLTQSGIPVLYSGDEVGQLNDYSYHDDPAKAADSRYLHRGNFQWDQAALCRDEGTVAGRIFQALRRLERIRGAEQVFRADAQVTLPESGSPSVLALCRRYGGEALTALFNFSELPQNAQCPQGPLTDLVTGQRLEGGSLTLPGYGFMWLKEDSGTGEG